MTIYGFSGSYVYAGTTSLRTTAGGCDCAHLLKVLCLHRDNTECLLTASGNPEILFWMAVTPLSAHTQVKQTGYSEQTSELLYFLTLDRASLAVSPCLWFYAKLG